MSAPTWEEVQSAIQHWIVAATGIAADRVRWAGQGGPAPTSASGAWVSINVLSEGPIGSPWIDVEDAANPVSLADVEFVARSQNRGTLSIQIFAGAVTGSSSGKALARRLEPALGWPSIEAITAGVVGLGAFETATDVPALINATVFEPRTLVQCAFHTVAEIRPTDGELGTYIEHVEIDGDLDV